MLNIANVIKDEKFFDGQIAYHDITADLCLHEYFILSWSKQQEFKYLKTSVRVQVVTPDRFIRILKTVKYNALFIHGFNCMPLHYMGKIPKDIKVFWFAWGYDIYNTPCGQPFINIRLYHPKTEKVLENIKKSRLDIPFFVRLKREIKYGIKNFLQYKKLYHNDDPAVYKKAVRRVDYFSGVFPLEYDLVKEKPAFHAKRVSYEYTNPADWAPFLSELPHIGENILIGNSADINNNHLDILDYIKDIDFHTRKLIVPLSYGSGREYAGTVAKAYKEALGRNCMLLTSFLKREQYFELLASVGVGIFFHERQQATCNIEELLRHGVKVFLSESSINYKHYKSVGYHIYSVQSDLNQVSISTPLTEAQKWHNAKTWYKTSNREYRLQYLYNIYKLLEEGEKQ